MFRALVTRKAAPGRLTCFCTCMPLGSSVLPSRSAAIVHRLGTNLKAVTSVFPEKHSLMDEAREILLKSLEASGVSLPSGVSSIEDLTAGHLVSVCAQSLRLMDNSLAFPTSMPPSVAERSKICADIASALKNVGYRDDLSFHQFLYPSNEDSYKLARFLVAKLSNVAKTRNDDGVKGDEPTSEMNEKEAQDLASPETSQEGPSLATGTDLPEDSRSGNSEDRKQVVDRNDGHITDVEDTINSLSGESSKIKYKINDLQREEKVLIEIYPRTSEVHDVEQDSGLLKEVLEMVSDGQHTKNVNEELRPRVVARRANLQELESNWEASKKALTDHSCGIQQPYHYGISREQQLEKVKLETEATLFELSQREEEHTRLLSELENQPQASTRRSYIHRISELTKSSRKQEADIERIQQDTRELQIESNSIRDRLHRTYAVVGETVIRDAKNDPVRWQTHTLLTQIHQSFEQIAESILATDRASREAADLEAKLTAMTLHGSDLEKLQADLEAIRKENDLLDQEVNYSG